MTIQQIDNYVFSPGTPITVWPEHTQVTLRNGKTLNGYFEGNVYNSPSYQENKWQFFEFPQDPVDKKATQLNGENIAAINLVSAI